MRVIQTVAMREQLVAFRARQLHRLPGIDQIILPIGDGGNQLRHQRLVILQPFFGQLFQQRQLVLIVEQREVGFHLQRGIFPLDDFQPQGVERRNHQTTRLFAPHGLRHTFFHLTRGLIGKGHGGDVSRLIATIMDQVSNLVGDDARLAGTCTGQHQAGPGNEFDGLLLAGI
ncbi:hypothetical protein D3C80_393470 [compost metagenome]